MDDTTPFEVVEPSSFVAAGCHLLVHLNSFLQYRMFWRFSDSHKKVLMILWWSHNMWRKLKHFRSMPVLISEISGFGE